MYEVTSADRATGKNGNFIGRFDNPDHANEEMNRRQANEPGKAFYCFWHVTPQTRLLINHTLYGGTCQ